MNILLLSSPLLFIYWHVFHLNIYYHYHHQHTYQLHTYTHGIIQILVLKKDSSQQTCWTMCQQRMKDSRRKIYIYIYRNNKNAFSTLSGIALLKDSCFLLAAAATYNIYNNQWTSKELFPFTKRAKQKYLSHFNIHTFNNEITWILLYYCF